jgi:hypothetical protein
MRTAVAEGNEESTQDQRAETLAAALLRGGEDGVDGSVHGTGISNACATATNSYRWDLGVLPAFIPYASVRFRPEPYSAGRSMGSSTDV